MRLALSALTAELKRPSGVGDQIGVRFRGDHVHASSRAGKRRGDEAATSAFPHAQYARGHCRHFGGHSNFGHSTGANCPGRR